jgi:membrane protease YdiL (CAAX protease family)
MSNPSTRPPIPSSTPYRLRSAGLLVVFIALYLAFAAVASSLMPARSMVVDTLVVLLAAVTAGSLLLVFGERRPWRELGFAIRRQTASEVAVGLAIPCAALLLVVGFLAIGQALAYGRDSGTFAGWLGGALQLLLVLAIPAAAEEALFRGYPFQKLVEAVGPVIATLLASAGFAFAHRYNPDVGAFALLNIFVAGVMLSVAFLRTRSLWFATAVHLGWNWQMAGPLDLPVSGLELFDAPLYEPVKLGTPWLTGGSFGPEGGIAGLIALLLVTVAVWVYTKRELSEQ